MKRFTLRLWSQPLQQEGGTEEPAVVDAVVGDEHKNFGIKSYLHQFYSPMVEEMDQTGAWYLLPPPPAQRMSVYMCRVVTMIGLLLLLAGAGLIIVGYTWRPNTDVEESLLRIAISQDEEGNFYIPPERFNDILQDPMHDWKIAGFCVFAAGASLMAISLLVPTCTHVFGNGKRLPFVSEDNTPNEAPVRIYPAMTMGSRFKVTSSKKNGSQRIYPTNGPVPVMEEITKVQPGDNKSNNGSPTADQLLMSNEAGSLLQ